MTNTLPPHIIPRRTPSSGTGLFTSQPIDAGELVFRVERPLITVLDSARLSVSCEWCLAGGKRDGDGVDGGGWEGEGTVRPSACTGCRIVRYCSKVGGVLLCLGVTSKLNSFFGVRIVTWEALRRWLVGFSCSVRTEMIRFCWAFLPL